VSSDNVAPEQVEELGQQKRGTLQDTIKRIMAVDAVALVVALVLLLVVFSFTSPHFFKARNFMNIGRSVAIMGITATGVTMGLIGGVFDLSIAAVSDLTIVLVSLAHLELGLPAGVCIVLGLLVGMLCGLINGVLVTRLRINPIIGTLGSAGVFRGIAFLLTGGQSHAVPTAGFRWLGRGSVLGVPSSLIFMLLVMALGFIVLRYTKFGRSIYAVGGNPVASRLAGLSVNRIRLALFIVVSTSAAFAGMVLLSKLGTMIPNAAAGTELDIIAASILGGTALAGGGGTMQGTLVGVLILGTLRNGLVINNVNPYWQEIASGIVLVVAVAIDILRSGGYR
jgi:ribose transport system permease protein